MKKLSDQDKFELLQQEYKLLHKEINDSFASIRAKANFLIAVYAFTFSGYIAALSEWSEFQDLSLVFIIPEGILFIISIYHLIRAVFLTRFIKWQSLGSPQDSRPKLHKANTIGEYYFSKVPYWNKVVMENNSINHKTDSLLSKASWPLVINIVVIMTHVVATVYSRYFWYN